MATLPLPGTSRQQAMLLLHCLYAWDCKAWALRLEPWELAELAVVAHRFNAVPVLQLADSSLVATCTAEAEGNLYEDKWLTLSNAGGLMNAAHDLGLHGFLTHCGRYMGRQASLLRGVQLDPWVRAVLHGASERHRSMVAMVQKAEAQALRVIRESRRDS